MTEIKYKACAFSSSCTRDGSIFLSVTCKCTRCGKEESLPVYSSKKFAYTLGQTRAGFDNNPNLFDYVPDGWHYMYDPYPYGLYCDKCYEEIIDFAKNPNNTPCSDEPKPASNIALDKDGVPIDFDSWYEFTKSMTGKVKAIEVFPDVCNVLLEYPIWGTNEKSSAWVRAELLSKVKFCR